MRDFRKLIAWQKAAALEDRLEPIIVRMKQERPVLADQLDRAVSSIPANIAEGCGRDTKPDFRRFLNQAIGSTTELENHLNKAMRLDLVTRVEHDSLVEQSTEVRKVTHGLKNSL